MTERLSALEIKIALQSGGRVNPSRPETFPGVWTGTPKEGSRWTVQQLAKIDRERGQARALNTRLGERVVALLRNPEGIEAWQVDLGTSVVDCPLLARTRYGQRVLIITPGGEKLWIDARC